MWRMGWGGLLLLETTPSKGLDVLPSRLSNRSLRENPPRSSDVGEGTKSAGGLVLERTALEALKLGSGTAAIRIPRKQASVIQQSGAPGPLRPQERSTGNEGTRRCGTGCHGWFSCTGEYLPGHQCWEFRVREPSLGV